MTRGTKWTILCFRQVAMAVSLPAVLLLLLALLSTTPSGVHSTSDLNEGLAACSSRKSQLSCIVGCFKCAEVYGRKLYDMGACCTECQRTQAMLVDDGPEDCSPKYFSTMAQFWRDKAQRIR